MSHAAASAPSRSRGSAFEPCDRVALVAATRQSAEFLPRSLALLYGVVFFSQFKPSEPFLVDFLVDDKGFSNHDVFHKIFPLYVYVRLPAVGLVGIFSELPYCFGCRGILALGAACSLAEVLITWLGNGLAVQQSAQFVVAISFASRYAVVPLVFAISPSSFFQQHTHLVKAVLLLSNSGSAILGEVLRDMAGASLSGLYAISAVSQVLSLLCAGLLLMTKASAPPLLPEAVRAVESFKAAVRDLGWSLRLPLVAWWTVWALALNSVHGLVLTYWQNLLRESGIKDNHNGYMLGGSYLSAAALVFVCRRSKLLRHAAAEALVLMSILSAGCLLCIVAPVHMQLPFYSCLLLFQCIFELTTAVSTFQVGAAITSAAEGETLAAEDRAIPRQARLTLLFSVTGVLAGITETVIQASLGHVKHMAACFEAMGMGLLVLFVLLVPLAVVTLCRSRSLPEPREPQDFLEVPPRTASTRGSQP